jgi:hypothetical protein
MVCGDSGSMSRNSVFGPIEVGHGQAGKQEAAHELRKVAPRKPKTLRADHLFASMLSE